MEKLGKLNDLVLADFQGGFVGDTGGDFSGGARIPAHQNFEC